MQIGKREEVMMTKKITEWKDLPMVVVRGITTLVLVGVFATHFTNIIIESDVADGFSVLVVLSIGILGIKGIWSD